MCTDRQVHTYYTAVADVVGLVFQRQQVFFLGHQIAVLSTVDTLCCITLSPQPPAPRAEMARKPWYIVTTVCLSPRY